jgi:hypothetical protein
MNPSASSYPDTFWIRRTNGEIVPCELVIIGIIPNIHGEWCECMEVYFSNKIKYVPSYQHDGFWHPVFSDFCKVNNITVEQGSKLLQWSFGNRPIIFI